MSKHWLLLTEISLIRTGLAKHFAYLAKCFMWALYRMDIRDTYKGLARLSISFLPLFFISRHILQHVFDSWIFPSPYVSAYSCFSLFLILCSLSLTLPASPWPTPSALTGTEPTHTAIKRTLVWVWKHYQGLAKLTLPLHTLTWKDMFVCTLCVQTTIRHSTHTHTQHQQHLALWTYRSEGYNSFCACSTSAK